jgi:hypothetical protein
MEVNMSIKTDGFKVKNAKNTKKFVLDAYPTDIDPLYHSKKHYKKSLKSRLKN